MAPKRRRRVKVAEPPRKDSSRRATAASELESPVSHASRDTSPGSAGQQGGSSTSTGEMTMAPAVNFARRIAFHRARTATFLRIARRRHLLAAVLARRALAAKQRGMHRRAASLLRLALRAKAGAGRAAFRARLNRMRIGQLQMARRQQATRVASA